MTEIARRKALLFLCLALTATLLIGIGLPRLKLQPGMPLPTVSDGEMSFTMPEGFAASGMSVNSLVIILLLAVLAARLLFLAYRLLKGANWRKLLKSLVRFLVTLAILFGLLYAGLLLLPASEEQLPEPIPIPAQQQYEGAPLGPTPPLLIWLVAIGLLIGALLLVASIVAAKRRSGPPTWQMEAEQARMDLLAGADLKEVILRCYQRMSQALQQEQHIVREAFMTTGEFERLLAAKGVPREPVHQITQLFEAVRYGHWQPATGDESRALESLDAILAYSRSAGQEH